MDKGCLITVMEFSHISVYACTYKYLKSCTIFCIKPLFVDICEKCSMSTMSNSSYTYNVRTKDMDSTGREFHSSRTAPFSEIEHISCLVF